MHGISVYIFTFSLQGKITQGYYYAFWDRLNICSITNTLNTQRLQSLFDLSIKERINYQHRNMETKYEVASFREQTHIYRS